MSIHSPEILLLAQYLLESEAHPPGAGISEGGELVRVCDKLRTPLVKLAGTAGFSSLLSRALSLAIRRDAWLARLNVTPAGLLEGLDTLSDDDAAGRLAAVILVAELLGVLVAIIGESLTRTVVSTAWPNLYIETRIAGSKEQS